MTVKDAKSTSIDQFVRNFESQLKLTCRLHHVDDPTRLPDFLMHLTIDAAKLMPLKMPSLKESHGPISH